MSSSKLHVNILKIQNKFINHDITNGEKKVLLKYVNSSSSHIVPMNDMDAQHILHIFQRTPSLQQDITAYKNTKGIDMNLSVNCKI